MSRPSTTFPTTDRGCNSSDLVRPDMVRPELVRRVAFPTPYEPKLRQVAALPAKEAKQLLTSARLHKIEAGDIFHDSLIETSRKSQRNTWASVGSLAFPLFFLVTLVVAPLYFTDPLPERDILTMLYVPPAPAAASNVTRLRVPTSTKASTSTRIPNPVRKTQEAPPPPVDTTSGVMEEFQEELSAELPEHSAKFWVACAVRLFSRKHRSPPREGVLPRAWPLRTLFTTLRRYIRLRLAGHASKGR